MSVCLSVFVVALAQVLIARHRRVLPVRDGSRRPPEGRLACSAGPAGCSLHGSRPAGRWEAGVVAAPHVAGTGVVGRHGWFVSVWRILGTTRAVSPCFELDSFGFSIFVVVVKTCCIHWWHH